VPNITIAATIPKEADKYRGMAHKNTAIPIFSYTSF
jgi:hypothetical protein